MGRARTVAVVVALCCVSAQANAQAGGQGGTAGAGVGGGGSATGGAGIGGTGATGGADTTGGGGTGGGGTGGALPEIDGDDDGYSVSQGDCDDTDPDIHPAAYESCDDRDNDCDGLQDEMVCGSSYDSGPTPSANLVSGLLLAGWMGAGAWRRRRREPR